MLVVYHYKYCHTNLLDQRLIGWGSTQWLVAQCLQRVEPVYQGRAPASLLVSLGARRTLLTGLASSFWLCPQDCYKALWTRVVRDMHFPTFLFGHPTKMELELMLCLFLSPPPFLFGPWLGSLLMVSKMLADNDAFPRIDSWHSKWDSKSWYTYLVFKG